eukprot:TRINITY_DN914_c0_g1_i2.p1 TRINITY_DN914_c0_g1~~TRINITY_DN914_c0_g1_i2.p1  ORF type:complete len:412 (+),score=68.51 TRINITY_DN914_c0_g1_i2:173-1408(+)
MFVGLLTCFCVSLVLTVVWYRFRNHVTEFAHYLKSPSSLFELLLSESSNSKSTSTTQKIAPVSSRFLLVVLLTTIIVFQICLFSLFGFERPSLVQVVIPLELEDLNDELWDLPLPSQFRSLNDTKAIFAFVHLRKVGGLSIRAALLTYYKSRNENQTNVVFIFCCEFGVRCSVYNVDPFLGKVVSRADGESAAPVRILGHLPYVEVQKVETLRNHKADCLTQFRHPLNRTISCFYYRTSEQKLARKISDYTPEKLRLFMRQYRDKYGHGCNNEILRMFSPETNETILNDPFNPEFNHTKTRELIEVAKKNIAQCVVFMLENPEQNSVISNEWMPEVAELIVEGGGKVNSQKYRPDAHNITQENLDVLLDMNKADLELYEYGVRWHQRLYRTAARKAYIKTELEKAGYAYNS